MASTETSSHSNHPSGGEKTRILIIAADPDLLGHLSSLDTNRWEVEAKEAWHTGDEASLAFVDGRNVGVEDAEKWVGNLLTVYLYGSKVPKMESKVGLGCLAISREQFLRSDIALSLSLLTEISSMVRHVKHLGKEFRPYARQAQIGAALQGFVHNVNNQMTAILGLLEIIRHENSHLQDIALLYEQCQRLHTDFSNLLRISRRDRVQEVTSFDLNALIREELRLIMVTDLLLRTRVSCETHLDANLPPFYGIYSDFSHTFVNLIRNAANAMSAVDMPRLIIRTGQSPEEVWLDVEDCGIGIPEDMVDEVFKPYFSLRNRTEGCEPAGLGLGLSTSRELLEKYGVKWKVESRVGVGTRFVLQFPKDKVCRPPDS
jgi:signal transduction histidine kinase